MLNDHVPTYETCLRLKELGFPQDTIFSWIIFQKSPNPVRVPLIFSSSRPKGKHEIDRISAPLLSEILEELKKRISHIRPFGLSPNKVVDTCFKENAAEAVAKLLIELMEKEKTNA